jgi:hypothetical protein
LHKLIFGNSNTRQKNGTTGRDSPLDQSGHERSCVSLAVLSPGNLPPDRPTCPPLPFLPEHAIALFSSMLFPIRASASAAHRHTVTIRWCTADTSLSYLQVSDVGHIQTPELRGKCAVLVPCRAKRYLSMRHPIASFRLRLIGNHQRHPILRDALYC